MIPTQNNIERLNNWNNIYYTEKMRWGTNPSLSARLTVEKLSGINFSKGLAVDFGCGYGRDLILLSQSFPSLTCVGIEGANGVINLWKELGFKNLSKDERQISPEIKLCDIFALDDNFGFKCEITLAYANYLFHLLEIVESKQLIKRISRSLEKGGYFVASFVATHDPTFGLYERLGRNCQKMEDGIWRYFDETDVKDLLCSVDIEIISLEKKMEEEQKRGELDRVGLIYVIGQKR